MSPVTQLLDAAAAGDQRAASDLLPLVYEELRKLAGAKLAAEKAGQTLQATALVHEAYLRLVGSDPAQPWNGRGHFFAAAAEAMRRILVEQARRKGRAKRGGGRKRVELLAHEPQAGSPTVDLLTLDESLTRFATAHPEKANLVKLKFFAGMTLTEIAEALAISTATVERHWRFAQAWLKQDLREDSTAGKKQPNS
jgi:RNA polymerase sigma factor (TIGR02999 family)